MKLSTAAFLSFMIFGTAVRAETPAPPRLCGIINLPPTKRAVLELPPGSPAGTSWSILAEHQREGGVELLEIHPETGSVNVNLVDDPGIKTLSFTNPVPNGQESNSGIDLENAPLESLMSLLAEFSGRTLLRWQTLSNTYLTVRVSTINKANAALVLQRALSLIHLAVIPDGDKFLMILPASEAAHAKPGAPKVDSSDATTELLPVGTINFPNTDMNQVMQIYAELVGKKLDRSLRIPVAGTIRFKNQTPLTRQEAIYALDTLFSWTGVKMEPVGNNFIKPVLLSRSER